MKKLLIVFSLAMMLVASSRVASASVVSSNLTFNGTEDVWVDESRSNFVDTGAAGLSAGDVIYGYVSFDEVNLDASGNTSISGGRIAALFSIQVTGETSAGSGIWLHGATTTAGLTLTDLMDAALVTEGVGGSAMAAGSMFAIVSSTTSVSPVNTATSLGFFTGAAWDIEGTGGVVAANGDYFQLLDESSVAKGFSGSETASLSVLQHALSPGVVFLPNVGADDFTIAGVSLGDAFGQIAIRSATISVNTNSDSASWALQDNGNFAFNAVPEPSTLAAWGILALLGVGFGLRRSKK